MSSIVLPVSVKGIILDEDKIWLRKNEREEWELPGGRMEDGECPQETVVRELKEELGFVTTVIRIVSADLYRIIKSENESKEVLVISYLCKFLEKAGDFEWIGEAGPADFKKFLISDVDGLNMPQFYKDAIHSALQDKV